MTRASIELCCLCLGLAAMCLVGAGLSSAGLASACGTCGEGEAGEAAGVSTCLTCFPDGASTLVASTGFSLPLVEARLRFLHGSAACAVPHMRTIPAIRMNFRMCLSSCIFALMAEPRHCRELIM